MGIEYIATKKVSRVGKKSKVIYLDRGWDEFAAGDIVEIRVSLVRKGAPTTKGE